jgi:hypothetical protein
MIYLRDVDCENWAFARDMITVIHNLAPIQNKNDIIMIISPLKPVLTSLAQGLKSRLITASPKGREKAVEFREKM